jgi:AAA family ATP:ADP antiporter
MTSYYVLRPIRDAMGVQTGNVDNLPWLFTGTLIAMIVLNPLFAALVRRLSAQVFIPIVYLFFISNLLVFGVLMGSVKGALWVGYAFFIWLSVFNLFVVSVFWMLMVDIVDTGQSKRLFGMLSAAASVGAICGSSLSAFLAKGWSHSLLMTGAAALLGLAILCVLRIFGLIRAMKGDEAVVLERERIGGSIWAGLAHVARSPYLLGIGLYILLYAITSTFLYFQQSEIAAKNFATSTERRSFFAQVDLAVNVLTLLVQVFLTSRILKGLGIAASAAFLPLLTVAGFGILAAVPTIGVLVVVYVLRRVGNFGLSRPTREVLFTVVSREDKYKAKSVVDTVVYRLGDQVGSWSYALVGGLGMAGVSLVGLVLAVGWAANALWLGRTAERRAEEQASAAPGVVT